MLHVPMLEDFGREGGNAGEVDGLEQSMIDLSGHFFLYQH